MNPKVLVAPFILLLVALVGFAAWVFMPKVDDPTADLAKAWAALQARDLTTVERHIDGDRLTEGLVDFIFDLKASSDSQKTGLERLSAGLADGLLSLLKPQLSFDMRQQMINFVQNGDFATGASEETANLLRKIWAETGGRPDTFRGFSNITVSGDSAVATATFRRPDYNDAELTLRLQLAKTDTGWRLVKVDDLLPFFARLDILEKERIDRLNTPVREAIAQTLAIRELQKSSGVSQYGVGQGVVFRVAYQNTGNVGITRFSARLLVTDRHGHLIRDVVINDSEGLAPGQSAEKAWPLSINPLSAADQTLYSRDDLTLTAQVFYLVKADGTELKLQ